MFVKCVCDVLSVHVYPLEVFYSVAHAHHCFCRMPFGMGKLAGFKWSARLCEDSRCQDIQLSMFDELSLIVDHKVSIMREGLANLLPFRR